MPKKKLTKAQAMKLQKQLVTTMERMLSDKMLHPDSKIGHSTVDLLNLHKKFMTKLKFMRRHG
tara:strand:+ start:815 stop:1003 length:189 start_codon:yes stop_codon:yes gene_type:complete